MKLKLLDIIQNNIKKDPDKIIFEDYNYERYTIKKIDEASSSVYAYLKDKKIGKEDIVALDLTRSVKIPITILGVLKAGAAFVVLSDRSTPEIREKVLNETKPKIIITDDVYDLMLRYMPLVGSEDINYCDLACVIYSTGSTGVLKGSMHEYGAIDKYALRLEKLNIEYVKTYGIEDINLGFIQGFYGISAILEIIISCVLLECLCIIPYNCSKNKYALKEECIKRKIKELELMPCKYTIQDILTPYLKYVDCGYYMASNIYDKNVYVYNSYGMTESFSVLSIFDVDKDYDITPVGEVFEDTKVMIVDVDNKKVLPNNTIGEICFEANYFRGYICNESLTSEVMQNGIYYTGDIGKYLPDGKLVVLGRKVDILKVDKNTLNSKFIIPFEIENWIKKKFNLSWAYVKIFKENECNGKDTICLYYTDDAKLNVEDINLAIKDIVTNYTAMPMYITHCKKIKEAPYFDSGKINRLKFEKPIWGDNEKS